MAREGRLAHQVRTGLGGAKLTVVEASVPRVSESKQGPLDRLYYRRPVRVHVQEFGALFGTIFLFVAAYLLWQGGSSHLSGLLVASAGLVVLLGYRMPLALYPIWKGWMALAHGLGLVVTFLLIAAVWCMVTTPIAVLLKLMGKHLMDLSFDPNAATYWEDRDPSKHSFQLIERQY